MKLQVGVKILIQNDHGEYLFIQRSKTMEGEREPHWDIPGGRINTEEALQDALAREVHEETGLMLINKPQLIAAQDIFVDDKELHIVRLTYRVEGEGMVRLSEEHQSYKWWSKTEALSENIDPYIRKVL